jgi:hypothetical protein
MRSCKSYLFFIAYAVENHRTFAAGKSYTTSSC